MFKTGAALLLTVFVSVFAVACGNDDSSDTPNQSGDSAAMENTEGTQSEAAMEDEQKDVGEDSMKPESDDSMKADSDDSMKSDTDDSMKADSDDAMKAEDGQ